MPHKSNLERVTTGHISVHAYRLHSVQAPGTRRHRGPPTSAGDKHEEAQKASYKCDVRQTDKAPGTMRHRGPPTSAGDKYEEVQRASYKCNVQ